METFAHTNPEHLGEPQLHLSNSNVPQVTTLSLVQPQYSQEIGIVHSVTPTNKNFVPGLFPENLAKFDDEQDPNVKIDIVRAFLLLFYPERGPTKKAKRSEFWCLYESLVPSQLQLNQANVGKQISKYLAETDSSEFGSVPVPLEIPNPDGVKKRKRNTSVQEQSEKCWKGFAGPRNFIEYQDSASCQLLRKLLKRDETFNFSFDYSLLDGHVRKMKEASKPVKQDLVKANVFQDASGYEVYILIPGLTSKYDIRLQINYNPRTWVVSGVIPNFNPKMPCISLEYPPGEFRREGKIPDYVDIQKVQKDYVNGVLKLTWLAHNQDDSRIVTWEEDPLAKQHSSTS